MKIIPNYLSSWKNNLWFYYSKNSYLIEFILNNSLHVNSSVFRTQLPLKKGSILSNNIKLEINAGRLTRIPYDFQKGIDKT